MERTISDRMYSILMDADQYQSPFAKSIGEPDEILFPLIRKYCLQTAAVSAFSSVPAGAAGIMTVFPEVFALLKLQSRMVKDIAAVYGKDKSLSKEVMLYCIFKKSGSNLFERFIRMSSSRVIVRPVSIRTFADFLQKSSPRLAGKFFGKGLSRILPWAGFVFGGAAGYLDTRIVAITSINLFSRDILVMEEENELEEI